MTQPPDSGIIKKGRNEVTKDQETRSSPIECKVTKNLDTKQTF